MPWKDPRDSCLLVRRKQDARCGQQWKRRYISKKCLQRVQDDVPCIRLVYFGSAPYAQQHAKTNARLPRAADAHSQIWRRS